jgi:hypothetical protein
MDNWLIFQYRSMRDQANPGVLRKALRGLPTPPEAASDGVTWKGKRTRALVVPGRSV